MVSAQSDREWKIMMATQQFFNLAISSITGIRCVMVCQGVNEIASRDIHEIARVLAQDKTQSTREKLSLKF